MEFAIDRFNDSVKFALERISKASLQLSPHQMNALQSILSGKDTFVCLPTKKVVAAEILSPITRLLVVTSSSIFLRAFTDR